ncbi:MAG: DUF5689 domain-containing protein [Rikenellaceae bacterium]
MNSCFQILLWLFVLLLLFSCNSNLSLYPYDDNDLNSDGSGVVPSVTHSIAGMKNLHLGSSHILPTDVIVEGVITATNAMGEYPNAIIIEDDSGAIELTVLVEWDWFDDIYSIGDLVRLNCTGLWIGSLGGNKTLGTEPAVNSALAVGYIYDDNLKGRMNVLQKGVGRTPQVVTHSDFRAAIAGCYICMKDVEYVSGAGVDRYCDRDAESGQSISTTHILRDCDGGYFELYVPRTAYYRDEILPKGKGDIYCTLDSYYNSYSVRMVCFDHTFSYY